MQRTSRRRRVRLGAIFSLVGVALLVFVALSTRSSERVQHQPTAARSRGRTASGPALAGSDSAGALSGRVRGEDGAGVANARVCGACTSCSPTDLAPALCATTDAAGRYALRPTPGKSLLISAVAAGFAPGYALGGRPVMPDGRGRSDLDIVLRKGGARLLGSVVDALGGPVAQARVQALRFESGLHATLETTSDSEGRFELWSSPGHVLLRAAAEGYAPATLQHVAPSADLELVLVPASIVRGRVLSADTHEPVEGVEIRAVPANGGVPRAAPAVSADDGSFTLSALEPGLYSLKAEGERCRGTSERPLEVGLGESLNDVIVQVRPAVSVVGRALIRNTSQGCQRGHVTLSAPYAGSSAFARTVPHSGGRPDALPSVTSHFEADGTVRFKGLTPGRYQAVLQCVGYVLEEGPELLEVSDRDLQVTWKLTEGLGLRVHTVDARGAPVAGAHLSLLIERPGLASTISMPLESDESGLAIVSSNLYPGRYTVEPPVGAGGEAVSAELRAGMGQVDLTLRLPGNGTILVHAEDEQGRGIDGLQVSTRLAEPIAEARAQDAIATALGDGNYRIGPLAAGAYVVEGHDGVNPPFRSEEGDGLVHVTAGTIARAQLRVARAGVVRGHVVDETGQAQANVWVTAEHQAESSYVAKRAGSGTSKRFAAMTDVDGSFTLERLRPDARYTLQAKEPFGSAARVVDVAAGQSVKIVLPSAGSLSGFVMGPDGKPAAGFQVQAQHRETRTTRIGRSAGPDGQFLLKGLPPGQIAISAFAPGPQLGQLNVELKAGEKLSGLRVSLASVGSASALLDPKAGPAR